MEPTKNMESVKHADGHGGSKFSHKKCGLITNIHHIYIRRQQHPIILSLIKLDMKSLKYRKYKAIQLESKRYLERGRVRQTWSLPRLKSISRYNHTK